MRARKLDCLFYQAGKTGHMILSEEQLLFFFFSFFLKIWGEDKRNSGPSDTGTECSHNQPGKSAKAFILVCFCALGVFWKSKLEINFEETF